MAGKRSSRSRVPVTILTGFLGSGKTTLLNWILSTNHRTRFAVIENEFGEVGVDDALVRRKLDTEETIVEMNNGCICCTVRGDLIAAIKKLKNLTPPIDRIVIETTGLADPAPVCQTFFVDEQVESYAELDAVVTVVDAKHITQHLDEIKPEGVENEAVEQVAFADRIVLNKTDLVTLDELASVKARLKSINSQCEILEACLTKEPVALDMLLGVGAFSLDRVLQLDPTFLQQDPTEHVHDDRVASVGFCLEGQVLISKLQEWIQELMATMGTDMYRYKGVLAVMGMDEKYVFQGVHMLFASGLLPGEIWQTNEPRVSRFVFIGKNLDRKAIVDGFMRCVVKGDKLRFDVGQRVECCVQSGKYRKGTVINMWDEGNPYRVRLDNGNEVWAPEDHDEYIRAMPATAGRRK